MAVALVLAGCADRPVPVPQGTNAPCADLTHQGFPRLEPSLRNTYFVCHNGLALQYAVPVRSALWVVERLDATALDQETVTRDKEAFRPDGHLPVGLTPLPERFTQSGYDRGHLAPAADFKENPAGMSHSFYTSNIVPQVPGNNRGIWARLEINVRIWARQKGQLYVVTGPVFYAGGRPFTPTGWLSEKKGKPQYVIEEYQETERDKDGQVKAKKKKKAPKGIAVPSHLYKVIYDPAADTAIAFVVPNADIPEQALPRYATTVAEVERLTNLRFFPDLPLERQGFLKTTADASRWVLTR